MNLPRSLRLLLAALIFAACGEPHTAAAQTADQPIILFPGSAPDPVSTAPETTTANTNPKGATITKTTNVSVPTMTAFHPSAALDKHIAVLVFPGGGFKFMSWDLEGTEVCSWLNSVGVTAVLVKYRVPAPEGAVLPGKLPLEDAQRAIGLVRSHAADWHIDASKVGVLGFSAGANLAALMSTHDARTWPAVDAADQLAARPDFALVIYPGDVLLPGTNNQLKPDFPVTKATPPTFIVQAENDKLIPNSVAYFLALQNAGVPTELHVFAGGGHGFGLRKSEFPISHWPELAATWMKTIKVLSN